MFCAGALACTAPDPGDRARAPAGDSRAAVGAPARVHYAGRGFTLELPGGSTVGRGPDADTLRGPLVTEAGRPGEQGGPGPHPTFQLTASVAPNPTGAPLAAWVDSVRAERNAVADEIAQTAPADPDSLGAEAALRLEPYCGDCDAFELYAARGARVATFAFERGIHLAGTREEQAAAYRAVFRTFRWTP